MKNINISIIESIFLNYNYTRYSKKLFNNVPNLKLYQFKYYKDNIQELTDKINIFYIPFNSLEAMIVKYDNISPRVFINSNIVKHNINYYYTFGIFAILNKLSIEFHAYNNTEMLYKIDDLVKTAFREGVEIKQENIINRYMSLYGQKFIFIILNILKNRELRFSFIAQALDIDEQELKKLYDDFIYQAYIDRLNNIEI